MSDQKLFTVEISSLDDEEIFDSVPPYTDIKAENCEEAKNLVIKELLEEFNAVEHEDFCIENCYEQDDKGMKKICEICCNCGHSVKFGSGRYVNRIPECNTTDVRIQNGMPHPEGDFICKVCEEKFDQEAELDRD